MNILDIIVWLALAVAVFNGWRKGFIGKLFSLAGLVGGIWLALGYGARCGEALHMEGTTAAVAGPIVVFVAAAVAANLVGRLVSKACSTIGLGGLDTLLGIALALLQAVLLLGLAFKGDRLFRSRTHRPFHARRVQMLRTGDVRGGQDLPLAGGIRPRVPAPTGAGRTRGKAGDNRKTAKRMNTEIRGVVTRATGSWYDVLHEGRTIACRIRGRIRLKGLRSTNPVVVGDEVVCEGGDGGG